MKTRIVFACLLLFAVALVADAATIKVKVSLANVRSKPDLASPVITRVAQGVQFESAKKVGGWYEISVADASGKPVTGYINSELVEEIVGAAVPKPPVQPEPRPEPAKTEPAKAIPPSPPAAAPAVQAPPRQPAAKPARPGIMIFGSFGMTQPSDSVLKQVYGNGTVMGGEVRFRVAGNLYLALAGGYSSLKGKLTLTQEETKMTIIPVEAMVLYHFLSGTISPYVGAGGTGCFYKESNVIGEASGSAFGFLGCAGITVRLGAFGIDARARYSSAKAKNGDISTDLGGLGFSASAGVMF
jgi:hypothetical protein